MTVVSEHKVKMVSSKKVFATEAPTIHLKNKSVSRHWESMVHRHLGKMNDYYLSKLEEFSVVILNHPISVFHANKALINVLSRMKGMTRADKQMLSCYYRADQPMKLELTIKDSGINVGLYKIYILGTSVSSDPISSNAGVTESEPCDSA